MPHLKVHAVESAKYKIFNSPYIASSYNHSTLLKFRAGVRRRILFQGKLLGKNASLVGDELDLMEL